VTVAKGEVFKLKVEGLNESLEALKDLRDNLGVSNATARNTLKRALIYAAQPIETDARQGAPVGFGDLRDSIITGTKLTRRQKAQHEKQGPVEIFVGAGPHPQAHLQEFGTAHHPPQSFLRPAVDKNVPEMTRRFSEQLKAEVEKTAARARRKLARLLAKGD
jgi:HK97 gp10 family phage protein